MDYMIYVSSYLYVFLSNILICFNLLFLIYSFIMSKSRWKESCYFKCVVMFLFFIGILTDGISW
jgi:hypothetical protein